MTFFDLSIPYVEKPGSSVPDARLWYESRLRTSARAMELGFTAVAYNRPFRGVLSDADRCPIVPFPALSFIEPIAGGSPAAFTAAVAFHRDLLGVSRASPFRQYTRITVSVDSVAAATALNSGKRLLRSYDLVAARPVNQIAFDQACQASEVDIIALDFTQKLPFRLKLPMVLAAIKRGVHFEISYSHLIADGHARRQILSDAKFLCQLTRGKNLIISGSATSLNEVRGPHDIANLLTIFLGLTLERAKAAISGNCRLVVANALRKKDCYFKETIKLERMLPEQLDSQGDWFIDCNDWDPISSGGGDLPSLDDMAKLFSAASTHPKSQNSIDFTSSSTHPKSQNSIDFTSSSTHPKSQNSIDFTSSINGMAPNAFLFSFANRHELDSAAGVHSSFEVEQLNIGDETYVENMASMVVKSASDTADEENKPCSDENDMAIDAFENHSLPLTSVSGEDYLSLEGTSATGVYGARIIKTSNMIMEDVQITDQVGAVSIYAEAPKEGAEARDFSLVCSGDQISMVDKEAIISVFLDDGILKEQFSEKMVENEERDEALCAYDMPLHGCSNGPPDVQVVETISSSTDVQLNSHPDIMELQEQPAVALEACTSKDPNKNGGQEYLLVPFETSTSEDTRIELEPEKLRDSSAAANVVLSDGSKLKMQGWRNLLNKRNTSKGFVTKTKVKKQHCSIAEVPQTAVSSEDPMDAAKEEQYASPENDSFLNAVVKIEGQNIVQPVTEGGVAHAHRPKSVKHRHKGRPHHQVYPLTFKNLCKPMLFKKKAGRPLRRMGKHL